MAGSIESNASDVKDGGNELLMACTFKVNDSKPPGIKPLNGKDVQLIDSPCEPGRWRLGCVAQLDMSKDALAFVADVLRLR
jgi:hypothetical protein